MLMLVITLFKFRKSVQIFACSQRLQYYRECQVHFIDKFLKSGIEFQYGSVWYNVRL